MLKYRENPEYDVKQQSKKLNKHLTIRFDIILLKREEHKGARFELCLLTVLEVTLRISNLAYIDSWYT